MFPEGFPDVSHILLHVPRHRSALPRNASVAPSREYGAEVGGLSPPSSILKVPSALMRGDVPSHDMKALLLFCFILLRAGHSNLHLFQNEGTEGTPKFVILVTGASNSLNDPFCKPAKRGNQANAPSQPPAN